MVSECGIPAPFLSINLGSAPQIQLDYYGAYPYYFNSNHRVKYKAVKAKKMNPKKVVIIQGNNNRNNNNKVNSNRGNRKWPRQWNRKRQR